ncbi:MAG TPA: hypothetical protein VMY59_06530 [Candidatus Thermoplasmatota archaeon]|nr:hypothetical protein [Candidatus Thermoplasmatota archaeon]
MELDNDVINHLLFHKALIDENNDMTRINQYLELAKAAATGESASMEDPFDRSVYLAFDLVLNQHMNPWDIDLVGFSSMYLKRAKKEKIDLMTAGRIIYMAWKVLRMQSDHLVVNMETKEEEIEQGFGWEDIPTVPWLANDDEYSYTNLLMNMPQPPLEEPLRRDSTRKVSLIELLSAFDEARKESEQYQLLDNLRSEERIQLAQKARKAMNGSAHEDHLEEDVATVWERICQFPKKSMNFNELCSVDSAEERIKTFISILFLAYEKKIIVHQQKFPYGEIFIKMIGYT